MQLSMRRIVLFTKDMPGMVAFYRDVLGLPLVKDEPGWKEPDASRPVLSRGPSLSWRSRRACARSGPWT